VEGRVVGSARGGREELRDVWLSCSCNACTMAVKVATAASARP